MLNAYVTRPLTLQRYRARPAGPHLDAFVHWLEQRGYLCPTPTSENQLRVRAPHGPKRLVHAGRHCPGGVHPKWASGFALKICQHRVDYSTF